MQTDFKGVKINYKRSGRSGHAVILLHGWGGDINSLNGIFNYLAAKGTDVVGLDLPGFGDSGVNPDFTVYDYADCVKHLIAQLKLQNVTIIGHSFGGRLALIMGGDECVAKLILIDSAGLKPRFSLKKFLAIRRYKRAKKRGRDLSKYGSSDYKALSGEMRGIFVRVVNTHLDYTLKKINKPTLLLWGDSDSETPLYMAKKILKKVKGSGLVLLSGGHFAYIEDSQKCLLAIDSFVNRG